MSILTSIVKTTFTAKQAELAAATAPVVVTNRAVARVIENQRSEGTVRGFGLIQDEPVTAAGTGKGPTPTDYFVASIAFCENVVFARNAALHDLDVQGLETTVTGEWDQRGLFGIGNSDPAFRSVLVETRLASDGPVALAVEVARLTHRRCPIHRTLERATALSFRLFVNGAEAAL